MKRAKDSETRIEGHEGLMEAYKSIFLSEMGRRGIFSLAELSKKDRFSLKMDVASLYGERSRVLIKDAFWEGKKNGKEKSGDKKS